ncbi:MAG: three-Cys-motif partner protein TcmP [Proteobacteria bacterium]|nr:three-Cys-motif partner protein TcmP [Pseudomonadota bacterium]
MAEREARPDPTDGLPAMPVGDWTVQKHELLKLYIEISRGVRGKFIGNGKAGATFIDLYCGAGRAYINGTNTFIDGSPLVGWKASRDCRTPFTQIHINDSDTELLDAAHQRLAQSGAPVIKHGGDVLAVTQNLTANLNPDALHFALLDPFNLILPFEVIRCLATLKRIDLLIHVSAMDLQRNWARYTQQTNSPLDQFAPGWRDAVDTAQPEERARLQFVQYWADSLKKLGFADETRFELITGTKNQPLYWLVLVAKHEIAQKFWKTAAQHGKTRQMF